MSSHILLTCPGCQRSGMRVRTAWVGRKVRCQHCQHDFRVPEDLNALRAWAEELEAANATALRARDEAAGQRDAIRAELDSLRNVASRISALESERDKLANGHRALLNERKALLAEAERAGALHAERDTLTSERDALRAQLVESQGIASQFDAYQARIDDLTAERDALRAQQDESREVASRLDILQAECDALTAERDALRAQQEESRELASRIEALQTECDRVTSDRDALRAQHEEMQDVAALAETLKTERNALADEKLGLLAKLKELTEVVERQAGAEDALRRQVSDLENQVRSLRESAAAPKPTAVSGTAPGALEREQQLRRQAEAERDAAREELETQLDQVFELASQLAAMRSQTENNRGSLEQQYRQEITRLTSERDSARSIASMNQGAVRALETRLAEVFAELQELKGESAPASAPTTAGARPDPISLVEAALQDISVSEVGRERVPNWKDPATLPGAPVSRFDPGHAPRTPAERRN